MLLSDMIECDAMAHSIFQTDICVSCLPPPRVSRAFARPERQHVPLAEQRSVARPCALARLRAPGGAKLAFPARTSCCARPWKPASRRQTICLHSLKIKPAVIDFPVEFRKDDATFKASLTQLEAAARFAAAIHCPRMMTYIMPSSDTPKDELRQTYKKRFTESARILADSNVRLGLEFLGPLRTS